MVELGEYNTVRPFVAIGGPPQDVSYRGTATGVQIGDHNSIDERVTIHRGTEKGGGATRIGDHNRLHRGAHIAHDCRLGDRISVGVDSMIAGHVRIGSNAHIDEKVGVHQFVTVGEGCFVGGYSKITQDVPCYMRVEGNPPVVRSINGRALKARGLSGESLAALREAHRLLYMERMKLERAATLLDECGLLTEEVIVLLKFLEGQHAGKMGRALVSRGGPRP
jgi:UDP-N-acetylglucosamine acyltransferase